MNVVIVDFDDTLCPSRHILYDAELLKVRLAEPGTAVLEEQLKVLDDEAAQLLGEAQKHAQVSILSNGTSSWVYGALGLLPKTLEYCCRNGVYILTGPDLYGKSTDCPLMMKKLGFASICDPHKQNLRLIASIGDGLPEYLACRDYHKENNIPKCRLYCLQRMEPANMTGQALMLRMIRTSLDRYLREDDRAYVEIAVDVKVETEAKKEGESCCSPSS